MAIDEEAFLKKFAKALGAEDVLDEMEQKKIKEQKLLEGLNNALTKLTVGEKLVVEEKFKKPVRLIAEDIPVGLPAPASKPNEPKPIPLGAQPLPQLPHKDLITKSVDAISQKARDEYVAAVDAVPNSIRKELDIIKKTITDLHRYASRASQMGGGGEVKFARLDDVNSSTIAAGLYLTYNPTTKMFEFQEVSAQSVNLSNITQDIVPQYSGVWSLGNSTNQWANLYVQDVVFPDGTTIVTSNTLGKFVFTNNTINLVNSVSNDIIVNPQATGNFTVNGNIIPTGNQTYTLGNTTNRFQSIYVGSNSIVFSDTLGGPDQTLSLANQVFYITQGPGTNTQYNANAGFNAGGIISQNYSLFLANNSQSLTIGNPGDSGQVIISRTVQIGNSVANSAQSAFQISNNGLTTIRNNLNIINPITQTTISPFTVQNQSGTPQGFTNPGVTMYAINAANLSNRFVMDTYGNNMYNVIAARASRGTINSPTSSQANDILLRITGNAFRNNAFGTSGDARIDLVASENFSDANNGSQINFWTTKIGTNNIAISASITSNGFVIANNQTGITFSDNTYQNTAFNSTSAVTNITVGTGLTQSNSVGNVGINATGVLSVAGTARQVIVANTGQNITLSTPQNLDTNSTVQFANLTVNNFTVTGTSTIANNQSLATKQLNLAYNSTLAAQIDGGGITLGNTSSAYYRSILYNLANDYWSTGSANFVTQNLYSNYINANNLSIANAAHFGDAYIGYDYPNAIIQADQNIATYSQIIEQNHSSSVDASTDFVAVNDIGNNDIHFIDFGINSSTWSNTDWTINGPSDGYLYIDSGNLSIGTATAGKVLTFFTGGTLASKLRMTINDSGVTVVNNVTANSFTGPLTGNVTGNITGTANNTNYVGSVSAANVVSNAQLVANLANYTNTAGLSAYQTTAGLSANVLTLTSNNTTYVGAVTASNVVSNAQLIANLANYQTTAGLSANVAKLTANNTSFVGSVSAANVVSNAQLIANLVNYAQLAGATFTGNVIVNANLTTNAIFTVGNATVNTVISGSTITTANLTTNYIVANGTAGVAGQVLVSGDGSSNVYWANPSLYFVLGANTTYTPGNATPQSIFRVGATLAANTRYQFRAQFSFSTSVNHLVPTLAWNGTAIGNVKSITYNAISDFAGFSSSDNNLNVVYNLLYSGFTTGVSLLPGGPKGQTSSNVPMGVLITGVVDVGNTSGTFYPTIGFDNTPGTVTTYALSSISFVPAGLSGANSSVGTWA